MIDENRWMRSILGICLATSLVTVDAAEWHTLKNCQFVPKEYNDGDSFHVEHRGKEYIFRLYFVDAPETEDRLAERIAEQAAYWKISTTETMQLAKLAAEFTEQQLKSHPFTVFTKWEPARGDSKLPRHYAFVAVNKKDLGELLMSEGLARLHGVKTDKPDGTDANIIEQKLEMLERTAKSKRLGAWAQVSKAKAERTSSPVLATPTLPKLMPNTPPTVSKSNTVAPAAASVAQQETTNSQTATETTDHRLSQGGIRHNSRCRYFNSPHNTPCGASDGKACKLCGG